MQDFMSLVTPGVRWENELLVLPPAGGGVELRPEDAASHGYLNLTLTVEEDHSMAFELRVWAAEETPRVIIRFGLMPRYRARIPLNMGWLDGHVLFPGHIPGELKVVCHGSRIAPEEIQRVALVGMPCFHEVRVRLEAADWSDAPCEPAPVPPTPLVDEMGQYIPKDWPGKTQTPEALNAFLQDQARLPDAYPSESWNRWGGCARRPMAAGTGFFSRVKQENRWYLLDPEGCAFFEHAAVVTGRVPDHELLRDAESAAGAGGTRIDDAAASGNVDDFVIPGAEWIGHADDRVTAELLKPAPVVEDFAGDFRARQTFEEGVGNRVTGNFVSGIEGFHFRWIDAAGGAEQAGVQMKRAFDAVFIEKRDEAAVLNDPVIVTHGQRFCFSLRKQESDSHFSAFPNGSET